MTRLAKAYPGHDFVLEVCSVHEWMMDLFQAQGVKAMAVIPPSKGPVGKKSDDDDATRLAKKRQAGEMQEVYIAEPDVYCEEGPKRVDRAASRNRNHHLPEPLVAAIRSLK